MRSRREHQNVRGSRFAIGGMALVLAGLSVAGCQRGGKGGQATPAGPATPASQQSQGTQVSVTPAQIAPISDTIQVTGALSALDDVTVGIKAAGKIVAVYAREGDIVRAGQVVAQQDTVDLQTQLDQARANYQTALTRLDQSKVAYKNAQTTLQWTDDQTRAAVRQAQAALDVARQEQAVVNAGARPQERQQAEEAVNSAKADVDSARTDRDKARSDLKRYRELSQQGAISPQELDQAQSVADSADARYNSIVAKYNSAVQALSLIQAGSRVEDIRRAQAAVDQAQQALATAQSNRDQVSLRRADVENARVGIEGAQAGVRQTQAALRQAEQALRDASIRTPITGVVAERKVEPGMQVAITKPDVMRIVALDSIYFDSQLSETQYAEVSVGQPVVVTVDALPGRTFHGAVSRIFPVASSARSFTGRIRIQNEGNTLRPQMFARGQITLGTHPRAIVVPREALLDWSNNRGRIFVVVGNKAHERQVKTGYATFEQVEITSGVQPGDKVVTVGQAQIQDGDKVQILSSGGAPASTASNTTASTP